MSLIYTVFLALAVGTFFGVMIWGLIKSEQRSKARDKQMAAEMAESQKLMRQLHQKSLDFADEQQKMERERHAAIMKHIKDNGPHRQPWED